MRNRTLCFWFSIIAFGAPLSWANENTPSGVNVGELAIIQSQTILLNAKAERAKAERSITGEDQNVAAQPTPALFPQVGFPPSTTSAARSTETQQDVPVVKAVLGSGKRLRATLLYSGGFEVDADVSSKELPGGFRVATLTVENVTLERGGKRYPLGFSNQPPINVTTNKEPTPSVPQFPPALPGLIPGQP
ncbi:type IV pilus biogenesis protein PilP [Pseudomonas yamanorum]|nr:type IV pilus biogenesis protein PilP [Pseudomonas yamanorum]